ncbi:hypothetical protein L6452_28008 [Arctium lappa]|uniref:Uncharacterized protein n=1 Tax=Arctium lappa TaxID=4217 RepID=A0ACB8ZX93_ARCLA|nr:hypothetical protein L6452_28008 [Arctium lappa]
METVNPGNGEVKGDGQDGVGDSQEAKGVKDVCVDEVARVYQPMHDASNVNNPMTAPRVSIFERLTTDGGKGNEGRQYWDVTLIRKEVNFAEVVGRQQDSLLQFFPLEDKSQTKEQEQGMSNNVGKVNFVNEVRVGSQINGSQGPMHDFFKEPNVTLAESMKGDMMQINAPHEHMKNVSDVNNGKVMGEVCEKGENKGKPKEHVVGKGKEDGKGLEGSKGGSSTIPMANLIRSSI